MKALIKNLLRKKNEDKKITCKKCGWSWNLSDGGDDPYTCHKCGSLNSPYSNFQKILDRFGENFSQENRVKLKLIKGFVENYVNKSGYNIKFLNSCPSYAGVRTRDQIIICSPSHMSTLGDFLYTLFHEIRHEQQVSQIKMDNPLSDFDLDDFEKVYEQYWEMELDADQFAKNMLKKIIKSSELPVNEILKNFKLSQYIENYPQSSKMIRAALENIISSIKLMKSQGLEYSDIQDHPMVEPYIKKLENFF